MFIKQPIDPVSRATTCDNLLVSHPSHTMKTALLIIDTQEFFASMLPPAIDGIKTLSAFFTSHSLPQYFTQHGHTKDELSGKVPNQLVRKWGADSSIAIGSDDDKLVPETSDLATAASEKDKDLVKFVRKNTYDAFISTDLAEQLAKMRIERVVVCGVMTDCCCDTTARSAFNRGWETWLAKDACASADDTQHKAGLKGVGFAFGEVLDTKEVVKRIKGEL